MAYLPGWRPKGLGILPGAPQPRGDIGAHRAGRGRAGGRHASRRSREHGPGALPAGWLGAAPRVRPEVGASGPLTSAGSWLAQQGIDSPLLLPLHLAGSQLAQGTHPGKPAIHRGGPGLHAWKYLARPFLQGLSAIPCGSRDLPFSPARQPSRAGTLGRRSRSRAGEVEETPRVE